MGVQIAHGLSMRTLIREMEERDEAAVSAILRRCYRWLAAREGYTPDQVEYLVTERGSLETVRRESRAQRYLVACFGDVIRGMIAVADAEVTKLYVHPEHHHRGVGTTLLEAAESLIRDAGLERMTLGTTPGTVPFYQRRGMSVSGRRLHETGVFSGRETVLMEKNLRPAPGREAGVLDVLGGDG